MRALAQQVGGIDHAYLSRMLSGAAPVNVKQVERVGVRLGLAEDYFPEVREARVVAAIHDDPVLRDKIYFKDVIGRTR